MGTSKKDIRGNVMGFKVLLTAAFSSQSKTFSPVLKKKTVKQTSVKIDVRFFLYCYKYMLYIYIYICVIYESQYLDEIKTDK